MENGGVSRPCLGEHAKPPDSVIMNTYNNSYWELSSLKYIELLLTSSAFKFSSPKGLRRSNASRSVEKLISGKTGWTIQTAYKRSLINSNKVLFRNTKQLLLLQISKNNATEVFKHVRKLMWCSLHSYDSTLYFYIHLVFQTTNNIQHHPNSILCLCKCDIYIQAFTLLLN